MEGGRTDSGKGLKKEVNINETVGEPPYDEWR